MENVATTYNFYDKKGRRLSAFCRFIAPTEAEIFILTCSLEDKFVKKTARAKYDEYITTGTVDKAKPLIVTVEIEPEQRELQTLIKYMRKNYFILRTIEVPVQAFLTYNEYDEIVKTAENLKI